MKNETSANGNILEKYGSGLIFFLYRRVKMVNCNDWQGIGSSLIFLFSCSKK